MSERLSPQLLIIRIALFLNVVAAVVRKLWSWQRHGDGYRAMQSEVYPALITKSY